MTLDWSGSLLGSAELTTAYWLYRRIAYTRYPALMVMLTSEAGFHFARSLSYPVTAGWALPIRLSIWGAVVLEVYGFACRRYSRRQRLSIAAGAVLASALVGGFNAALTHLRPLASLMAAGQYYRLGLVAALLWLMAWLWRNPVVENRDHAYYRQHALTWMAILAVAGMFSYGGLGYLIFPATLKTWLLVNWAGQAALLVNVVLLGYRMARDISSLRPEVAVKIGAMEPWKAKMLAELQMAR